MKTASFGFLCVAMTALCACGKVDIEASRIDLSVQPVSIALTKSEKDLTLHVNSFASALYGEVLSVGGNSGKDVLISPFSASAALAMTASGAEGHTAQQMRSVLGFGSCSRDDVDGYYFKLLEGLSKADPYTKVVAANAIWANKDRVQVKDGYANRVWSYYSAPVKMSYMDEDTRKDINKWVSDRTDGAISEMMDSIDDSIAMALLNALYFNGMWRVPFSRTETQKFNNIDGTKSRVEMMCADAASLGFHADDGLITVRLPYGAGAFSMYIVMNADGLLIPPVLTEERIGELQTKAHEYPVNLKFPSFKMDCSYDFANMLIDMGMTDAFNLSKADFSGISDTNQAITNVLHKSHIDVSRCGTEAAAATEVIMKDGAVAGGSAKPMDITVDTPFAFMITEQSTGLVLFMGQKVSF